MASCAHSVWGKPSSSACEVSLGRGHWAGNATCWSADRGRGGSSQSDQFAPEAGPRWWPRGRAAQARQHTHLISCPLQTTEYFHVTPQPLPAAARPPWDHQPSAGGQSVRATEPGEDALVSPIGEGILVPQDTGLIWQNLCRKSASALPERPGEALKGGTVPG